MYFIKELRQYFHIIIHAEVVKKLTYLKLPIIFRLCLHRRWVYVLKNSLVNEGRERFSDIRNSAYFRIPENEFEISRHPECRVKVSVSPVTSVDVIFFICLKITQ